MSVLIGTPRALRLGTEQMCEDALTGTKTISIRTGLRDFPEGELLVLYNEDYGFAATATIDTVRYCSLQEVREQEWLDDGFDSWQDLYSGLLEFYPNITPNSDVTILRWVDVKHPRV